jgi:uncharacterized membrane protein
MTEACPLCGNRSVTATVAAPTGNQFGVLLAIFLVITFATVVVLWVHERRWDRHEAELAVHHEQLATLAGRLQSIADFLQVDVHDARDDSPAALAMRTPRSSRSRRQLCRTGFRSLCSRRCSGSRRNGLRWRSRH